MEKNISKLVEGFDQLQNEIREIKASLSSISGVNDNIDKKINEVALRVTKIEESMDQSTLRYRQLQSDYRLLQEKIIKMESQSRRDNLLFDGIAESPPGVRENEDDCLKLLRGIMVKKMGILNANQMRIVRCHRLGLPPSNSNPRGPQIRPRTIIAKFHWFGDRQTVWQARLKLKGSDIFVSEDFPKEIVERRKVLLPIMHGARKQGFKSYLQIDKLHIIKDDKSTYSKPMNFPSYHQASILSS